MLMFNEFCRALELIEKSGKNGSKQQCLDSLWQKVLQSTLLFKQHCSFFFQNGRTPSSCHLLLRMLLPSSDNERPS